MLRLKNIFKKINKVEYIKNIKFLYSKRRYIKIEDKRYS